MGQSNGRKTGSKLDTRRANWSDAYTDASWLDQFATSPELKIPEHEARELLAAAEEIAQPLFDEMLEDSLRQLENAYVDEPDGVSVTITFDDETERLRRMGEILEDDEDPFFGYDELEEDEWNGDEPDGSE